MHRMKHESFTLSRCGDRRMLRWKPRNQILQIGALGLLDYWISSNDRVGWSDSLPEGKKDTNWYNISQASYIMTYTPPSTTVTTRPGCWWSSDDDDTTAQVLEPIRWNGYSNICSSVVKHDPNWLQEGT
ncbi:hypothetical protein L2E82_05811 [Cichorium intybus]|uniref:Uncharacterized protein n=1 Tax=Cichorium intybus TaxID=13427 RepID=A0ACB9H9U7_CICIN|nr:hypothetical protein L2E82_05811 [Cichorium intybus]